MNVVELKSKYSAIPIILLMLLFIVILFRTAWVSDDGYITFRVVDNFVHGHGLTWNTQERVETYSNPLWMFLVSIFYFFTHEIYYTDIFLSISISIIVISLFAFKISKSLIASLLGIVVFIFSKAFTDYSTSGLENPLTHLILAIFLFIYIKSKNNFDFKTLFLLSVLTALGTINRLDMALLFIPCLFYAFLRLPKLKGLRIIITGLLPLIIWKGFTLFYYGFPFPNTAYAKVIDTGISKFEFIKHGIYYFYNTIRLDPLTLLVIGVGISLPLLMKKKFHLPIVLGIMAYLLYIIIDGGDFMSGRYFTVPLLASVVLISQYHFPNKRIPMIFIFSIVVLIGITSIACPLFSGPDFDQNGKYWSSKGIEDERGGYYHTTGLLRADKINVIDHQGAADGIDALHTNTSPIIQGAIGFSGYYAGPDIYVIDYLGLGDPLLSKLPTKNPDWGIGHIRRQIPPGYIDTIKSGQNAIVDRDLANYYDKLSIITRGNLFDIKRLQEIWNMNTGKYDHLIIQYESKPLEVNLSNINKPKKEGTLWDDPTNITFDSKGIQVNLGKIYSSKQIKISADSDDDYELSYYSGNSEIAKQNIHGQSDIHGLKVYDLNIPQYAIEKGYDIIKIKPVKGDGRYSIGHIILQ